MMRDNVSPLSSY